MLCFYAWVHLLLLIWSSCGSLLYDMSSFIARNGALVHYQTALLKLNTSYDGALDHLQRSHNHYPCSLSSKKLSWMYELIGDVALSERWREAGDHTDDLSLALQEGIQRHYLGDAQAAIDIYHTIFQENTQNNDALFHMASAYMSLGDMQQAAGCYYAILQSDPFDTKAILGIGYLHLKYGSQKEAASYYQQGVDWFQVVARTSTSVAWRMAPPYLHKHNALMQFNLGLAYFKRGELAFAYSVTKALLKNLVEIQISLDSEDPVTSMLYDPFDIDQEVGGALGSLSKIQRSTLNWAGWEVLHEQLVNHTLTAIAFNRAHYCDGIPAEEACQAEQYGTHQRRVNFNGPLLPFDTLMLPLSMEVRLEVAIAKSLTYSWSPYQQLSTGSMATARKLRLGFISCDFLSHPTAQLVEALFQIIIQAQKQSDQLERKGSSLFNTVELVVFSYGGNDGSSYRRNLENLAHKFVDVVNMPFSEAAAAIRAEEVDILLDLQIHTLGSRLEITAAGVAPTVVNYLVYPGTSGGRFYDYLAVDRVVVPPEQARYYSEALLVLPATYQVSSYDAYAPPADVADVTDRLELRRLHGLPLEEGAVVFCNFNKVDKLDPQSFQLWMQVLIQVPNSYLWLMGKGDGSGRVPASRAALMRAVAAEGVEKRRILFAGRASKAHHVHRHAAADLFLDTIVYGAHSTATDALRGGLPVLTLQGEAFASRVAASLYASLALGSPSKEAGVGGEMGMQRGPHPGQALESLLVVDSAKEFVDTAVRIGTQVAQRRRREGGGRAGGDEEEGGLEGYLDAAISAKMGLFNATRNVELFVRGMQVVEEARHMQQVSRAPIMRRWHTILR